MNASTPERCGDTMTESLGGSERSYVCSLESGHDGWHSEVIGEYPVQWAPVRVGEPAGEADAEFACLDGEGAVCGECPDCTDAVAQSANADVRAALAKGRRNDELLDGREFDAAFWNAAEAALTRLEGSAPRVSEAPRGAEGESLSGGFPDVSAEASTEVGAEVPGGDETEALRAALEYLSRKNPTSTWDLASRIDFVTRAREALARVAGLEATEARLRRALERIADGPGTNSEHRERARAALADSGEAGS